MTKTQKIRRETALVLDSLTDGAESVTQIAEDCGVQLTSAPKQLARMVSSGLVDLRSDGGYSVTRAGEEALAAYREARKDIEVPEAPSFDPKRVIATQPNSVFDLGRVVNLESSMQPLTSGPEVIELPWPKPELSPNARVCWRTKHRASKSMRHVAGWTARHCGLKLNRNPEKGEKLTLKVIFEPPNNSRRRDDDNLIASFKPYRDGIADALHIDDNVFKTEAEISRKVFEGGRVLVQIY